MTIWQTKDAAFPDLSAIHPLTATRILSCPWRPHSLNTIIIMQEVAERTEDVRPDALGNAMSIPVSRSYAVLRGENGVTVEGENLNTNQQRALAEESGFSHLQKEGESCRT